jgi:hypothetical protein
MVRLLIPWYANVGKRLVKSPKLYIRDSGLLHSLLSLGTQDVWFRHTHNGAEIDLIWQDRGRFWGLEVKYADAPTVTKSVCSGIHDLDLSHVWIVYPGKASYRAAENVTVLSLRDLHAIAEDLPAS